MDEVKIEEFKNIISILYGKIYAYNNKLLSLSETQLKEGEIYRSIDIFDFYITSHAQAYLKNLYFKILYNFIFNLFDYLTKKMQIIKIKLKEFLWKKLLMEIPQLAWLPTN